jgi:hypothetical protein
MHFNFFWGSMLPTGYTCNGPIQNYRQLSQNLCGGGLPLLLPYKIEKKPQTASGVNLDPNSQNTIGGPYVV